jgi:hypothetical protein
VVFEVALDSVGWLIIMLVNTAFVLVGAWLSSWRKQRMRVGIPAPRNGVPWQAMQVKGVLDRAS